MWCCRPAFQLHRGVGREEVMSSTLVETVSINYEDFNESFLTCGTCLFKLWTGSFDGGEHTPKLLHCSHTVCLHCLTGIVASHARDDGTFRCPICRESIRIPSGGVAALPPSFLVNQLLDLMSRQRREVIPKCSTHANQELLFCESCDLVFCTQCSNGSHQGSAASYQHTVIPLSIAIKRMSEILCYKANECYSKLNEASDAVTSEMHQLDHAVDNTFEDVNRAFQAIIDIIEQRRDAVISNVKKMRDEKKKVLQDQLDIIESERRKVQQECEGLQYQVEVRNITKKIAHLNTKIDSLSTLVEPRENAFLRFESQHNEAFEHIQTTIEDYGRVMTSKTFPSLCFMKAKKAMTHLRSEVVVYTVDYDGESQTTGGDPLESEVKSEGGDLIDSQIEDNEDGTYSVFFTPENGGNHSVAVKIFGRPIKESPLIVEVLDEHNPDIVYGSRGSGKDQFLQPVGICIDDNEYMYVADTGNSRIKVLSPQLKEVQHIVGDALEGRSVTGITRTPSSSLAFVNWRKKTITEVTSSGQLLSQFTHDQLKEPTTLAVNCDGEILVADNAANSIFVFLPGGKLVRRWGVKGNKPGQLGSIAALCTGPENEVIVADSRIQVFSPEGQYVRTIFETKGKGPKGTYGGLFLDPKGLLLATRQERNNSCIQVFDYILGTLIFTIDSREAKLKRPSGLATTQDGYVIIVDLGNDCVKKFRYM
ncbi:tripartite motif-containing protein 2-like isoform X1 [Penaeus chinensis]|uniref:tripartite motif-containing protein 2-like isoform X1 n=1 Tax=Penaeus chinensis TaxID=139456 RepID=UPI001FB6C3A4|nr:tripartite motif-containing protein 2-like isoform X1 [Penaeus chinensis]XP_047481479.1 tripartite motif-containing protein 2-like isoform X1 [Penaeus chinensis]XP_047481480.1 tripartite motif-containing protein 2-like isoform X1 [Penaeus chinensis]XP_047481481.1 tripartite motif-containing protein 2-like isoform X1 [Penaeus chinensis]